ncbi:unnamed protein product [Arctia plantaginis]|uniref:Down syndrome cell adhesion molecule-like protein Dscam2 n=1 Tax=Arctia plantaginis TaxID=874455 RepID=A0A8S1A302_ARCPL|nr:unnamed protein product [Arctia plantaginis]
MMSTQIEEKSLNEFSLLMFSDLSAQHSGAYTCRVSNHAATVNYTANLSVKVAPSWMTEPLDAAVLLGAPLLLECAAKGYPAPTITWYRRIGDGGEAEGGGEQWEQVRGAEWGVGQSAARTRNGSLAAESAARSHQGLYRCIADNGVGPPLVKPVNVTVHEPAHFEGSGGNVSCVRGRSASLVCLALGDAPLDVHWSHRGVRLDLTSYRALHRRWAVTEARTGGGLRSTLQLRAAERADGGEYRCHAHNRHGRSEQLMYLHVDEPPEAPRRLLLGGVGSRWVRVSWSSASSAAPPMNTYTALYTALHALPGAEARQNIVNLTLETTGEDRIDADGLHTLSARLDGLRPASAYSLRLTASNHVGQSLHSEPLLFSTLEEAPSASPQNVRVRAANVGELHVSWSAPPQDNWNGELLGYVVSWRELSRFDEDDTEDSDSSPRHAGNAASAGWSSVELTLSGLRSFARYALTVRAFNRAGAGPHSPAVYATTADGVPELAPRSVTCEPLSPRTLRVRWTPLSAQHAHALRGYDLHYAPIRFTSTRRGSIAGEAQTARAGVSGEATLQGLQAASNYSVWVRARADAGLGPPSTPVYCETTEDVPEAVMQIRALGCAPDAVRVTWLAPANTARLTHYTLYTRELGKVGGEWAQRVDVAEADRPLGEGLGGEVWREVRGLRERTVYEFWVRAATAAGAGPPSRPVTAAPAPLASARISSFSRVVYAAWGSRVRFRCAAVGAPPLRWRWSPLPTAHTITDTGDLIIHKVELMSGGNYTCVVRNGGGSDALSVSLVVRLPPAAPVLRLVRADVTALLLAWDVPSDGGAALLGYTLQWSRGDSSSGERSRQVPPADTAHVLSGLACGAVYRVTLRAHNAVGVSPHSRPLLTRTRGDKARAPPGKALVWANSTVLRLNLLAWGGRCPVTSWSVALRAAASANWLALETNGETAEANNLRPGSWYEIRVVAHSPAGDTVALYKAATHTINGERLGEAVEVPAEAHSVASDDKGKPGEAAAGALWRTGLAPALFGGGLALLLAILTGVVVARRRAAWCVQDECSLQPTAVGPPHPQLYTTEPSKRNGKALTPPDVTGELHEISPYATFSMSGAEARGAGCALHLRTFGRAEALDLAAPPPRPNLLAHSNEYGRGRDSDSESSGSPCAACAAELYRLPAAHLSDTLPAVESSADDTSYSAGAARGAGAARQVARARRRRDHARHASQPTVRYFPMSAAGAAGTSASRRDQLP